MFCISWKFTNFASDFYCGEKFCASAVVKRIMKNRYPILFV